MWITFEPSDQDRLGVGLTAHHFRSIMVPGQVGRFRLHPDDYSHVRCWGLLKGFVFTMNPVTLDGCPIIIDPHMTKGGGVYEAGTTSVWFKVPPNPVHDAKAIRRGGRPWLKLCLDADGS